jgi:hypothetical protein
MMTRLTSDELQKRNEEIEAGDVAEMASKYRISPSHVYRIKRGALRGKDAFDAGKFGDTGTFSPQTVLTATGPQISNHFNLFEQLAKPGLMQFSGNINEDYDNVFKPLYRKIKIYREMADDPIVASVLNAVRMRLRAISWRVTPAGTKPQDKDAALFLETNMNDMAYSWFDVIDQTLDMLQNGFSIAELCYKRRNGRINSKRLADSKYDDGLIGWRKWVFVAPDTLAPGTPWSFDDSGALVGFTQLPPPIYRPIAVSIEKSILFRTTTFKNNPEGRALLRPMYPAWYFKKNLEEIEAISAERMGAGYPVIYLGEDVNTNAADANSDISYFMKMAINIRVDEQMAAVLPFKKMGTGANNDKGVLIEFLSPPSQGGINFNDIIQRYEKRMAMVGLAQFIHLGMDRVGSQALSQSSMDFFTVAISAWADLIEETIHRFATERLFCLNNFNDLTDYPRITHDAVGKVELGQLADYINKLSGQMLITPSPELEDYLRAAADLPEKPANLDVPAARQPTDVKAEDAPAGADAKPDGKVADTPATADDETENAAERFADGRGGGPGPGLKQIRAVNAYQAQLEKIYDDWSDTTARDLSKADEDERDAIIAAALLLLLAALRDAGRKALTAAMLLALGDEPPSPEMLAELSKSISDNDRYLSESLIPALLAKITGALTDPDILAAMALGIIAFRSALRAMLATSAARVASYAGAWWTVYNRTLGDVAQQNGRPVRAYLDPRAKHCDECPMYASAEGREYPSFEAYLRETGGRVPGQFECGTNCRCELR